MKISQYTALTSLPETMRFVGSDTGNPSMAASGTTEIASPAVMGLPLQPTGDTTGVKDTPNVQAAAAAGRRLATGTFYVSNLPQASGNFLAGSGAATVLQPVAGTTGAVVSLATAATTRQVTVRDLTINLNSVSGLQGVNLTNTGLSPSTPGFHRLEFVNVINGNGADAFYYQSQIETYTLGCLAFNILGGMGFNVQNGATDSRWVSCTAGATGSHGYYASGSNNHYVACKSYYAGYNGSAFSTGHGFYITGVSGYFSSGITFTGCEAQDCAQNGWFWDPSAGPCYRNAMTGCVVDSCNAVGGSGALACGINTNSLTYSSITGNVIFNRSGGAGVMPYGIAVTGTQTGLALNGNSVSVTNTGVLYVSGSGYVLTEPYQFDISALSTAKFAGAAFTGTVTAPTAPPLTNSTQVATTAYADASAAASAAYSLRILAV